MEFTPFKHLPVEVRKQVWRAALVASNPVIFSYYSGKELTELAKPERKFYYEFSCGSGEPFLYLEDPLFNTCRESQGVKAEEQREFDEAEKDSLGSSTCCIRRPYNPNIDLVYIHSSMISLFCIPVHKHILVVGAPPKPKFTRLVFPLKYLLENDDERISRAMTGIFEYNDLLKEVFFVVGNDEGDLTATVKETWYLSADPIPDRFIGPCVRGALWLAPPTDYSPWRFSPVSWQVAANHIDLAGGDLTDAHVNEILGYVEQWREADIASKEVSPHALPVLLAIRR